MSHAHSQPGNPGSALLDQEAQQAPRRRAAGTMTLGSRLASPRRRKTGPPSSRDKVWDLLRVTKKQILADQMSAAEGHAAGAPRHAARAGGGRHDRRGRWDIGFKNSPSARPLPSPSPSPTVGLPSVHLQVLGCEYCCARERVRVGVVRDAHLCAMHQEAILHTTTAAAVRSSRAIHRKTTLEGHAGRVEGAHNTGHGVYECPHRSQKAQWNWGRVYRIMQDVA